MAFNRGEGDLPADRIERCILMIRGEKVMLDVDFAQLYGVETRTLLQAVKRNAERFPSDFAFQLTPGIPGHHTEFTVDATEVSRFAQPIEPRPVLLRAPGDTGRHFAALIRHRVSDAR